MTQVFQPLNPGLCKFGLAMAAFMQVLDSTIANVSLPAIAGDLGASTQQSTWVITSFAVCNAIALPLTGWLVRRFGEVRLFVVATALFTLASILCGIAVNMGMLTVFRALQGFVAGPIVPVGQALMISLFPDSKRTQAIAALTIVVVFAPIVGPILGGWITDNYSWPWIFFINAPVGLFACLAVWGQMRRKAEQTQRADMDYAGLILLGLGVGSLQIILDMGNEKDWFQSSFIVVAAVVAAVSISAFLIVSLTRKDPIIDLHMFRHRNFTVGTVTSTLALGVFTAGAVLLPLWLQTQMRYTAVWAGLAMAPIGLAPILVGALMPSLSRRIDLRVLTSVGFVAMAVVLFLRSFFTSEVDFATVAYLQLFQGVGLAMFAITTTTMTLSGLKPEEVSSGTGLTMFIRTLGGSFFVSITSYLWTERAVVHRSQFAEQFALGSPRTEAAVRLFGQGDTQTAMTILDYVVTGQSYQISFNELHYAFGVLLVVLGALIWLAKPPFETSGDSSLNSMH